jgi:hypothetical protein
VTFAPFYIFLYQGPRTRNSTSSRSTQTSTHLRGCKDGATVQGWSDGAQRQSDGAATEQRRSNGATRRQTNDTATERATDQCCTVSTVSTLERKQILAMTFASRGLPREKKVSTFGVTFACFSEKNDMTFATKARDITQTPNHIMRIP